MADDISLGVADYLASPDAPVGPRLKSSLFYGVQQAPDVQARMRQYSRTLGLPLPAALGDAEHVKAQGQVQELDPNGMVLGHPVTANWLAEPDNAAVAHDDVDVLKGVEDAVKNIGRTYLGASAMSGLSNLGSVLAKTIGQINDVGTGGGGTTRDDLLTVLSTSPEAAAKMKAQAYADKGLLGFMTRTFGYAGPDGSAYNPAKAQALVAGKGLQGFTSLAPNAGDYETQASRQWLEQMDDKAKEHLSKVYATLDPNKAAYLDPTRVAGDLLQQVPTMAALVLAARTGNAAGDEAATEAMAAGADAKAVQAARVQATAKALAATGAVSEGAVGYAQQAAQTQDSVMNDPRLTESPVYIKLRQLGFSDDAAKIVVADQAGDQAGVVAGAADAAVNFIGGGWLGKIIGEGGPFLPRTAKGFATEGLTEAAQSPLEQYGQNTAEQSAGLPTPEGEGLAENAVQGLVVGGLMGGPLAGIAGHHGMRGQKVEQATADQEKFTNLMKAAEASKLRERDPQTFQEFMDAATQGGPVEKVYVPADKMAEVLAQGKNAEIGAQLPGVMEQLPEAMATGGLVEVPVAAFATHAAGTPLGQGLLEHMKVDPEGFTMNEAQEFLQTSGAQLQHEVEQLVQAHELTGEFTKSAQVVHDNIAGQLDTAKRFTPDVNQAYASLVSTFYATQAARLGTTPEALFEAHPLNVRAAGVMPDSLTELHQEDGNEAPLRSGLINALEGVKSDKLPAAQWVQTIKNLPGVKAEELEWTGLMDWLKARGETPRGQNAPAGPVTKGELLDYLAEHRVRVHEVIHGEINEHDIAAEVDRRLDEEEREHIESLDFVGDHHAMETNDGEWVVGYGGHPVSYGDTYDNEDDAQEAADEMNSSQESEALSDWRHDRYDDLRSEVENEMEGRAQFESYKLPGGEDYRELLLTLPNLSGPATHWDEPNVVAHARIDTRADAEGRKVLFVEEVQSDWHQKGRDQGYEQLSDPAAVERAERALQEATQAMRNEREKFVLAYYKYRAEQIAWLERAAKEPERTGITQEDVDKSKAHERLDKEAGDSVYAKSALNEMRMWEGATKEAHPDIVELAKAYVDADLRVAEASMNAENATRGKSGIPNAPFKSSWPALVMKRLIQYAVANGHERIAWTTGQQQIDRYNLSHALGSLQVHMRPDGRVSMLPENGRRDARQALQSMGEPVTDMSDPHVGGTVMNQEQLTEAFGRDLGARIYEKAKAADFHDVTLEGDDLKVGGQGMIGFYDRMLVSITNDLIKKYGAKVGPVLIEAPDMDTKNTVSLAHQAQNTPEWQAYEAKLEELHAAAHAKAGAEQRFIEVRGSGDAQVMGDAADAMRAASDLWRKAYAEVEALQKRLTSPVQPGFDITPKMAEAAKAGFNLFQGTGEARGTFNPGSNTIVLLKNADLSTFLHETGHFYLETLARLAADPTAPQEIANDWAEAAKFVGMPGVDPAQWLSTPVDARRDGHELWARGFEAYLREGRAPSLGLQGLFQRFKAWLVNVYESLSSLKVELTPEVRGVFDRLLATEKEIAHAQQARAYAPVFTNKPPTMTDQEWEAYQRLGAEATADAQDQLQARSIRDMRWLQGQRERLISAMGKDAREKRAAVRAEVASEVSEEPVYKAATFLRRGTLNGEPVEGPHKLSIPDVEAMLPEGYQRLGYGRYGMLAAEGLHPDTVAELAGFTSGDELLKALISAEPMRDKIEGITDQRMLERYGDLTSPEAIARAADEAIHNDARMRFVATEANALAKAAGKVRIMAEAARDYAAQLIGRQRVRDLRPARYSGAETKAAAASARAAAKGDLVTAATEKRNQLINGYAAKAVFQAQQEVERALRYFARLDSPGARKAIDPDYRDQIDQLLERFDLRKSTSLRDIDKRKSLAAWIEAQRARGFDPVIDPELENEANRKHFKDMTVDEVRGLVDAVRNIVHLGRLKTRLLVAARGRAFAAVVDEAEATIRDNAYQRKPDKVEHNTVLDRLGSGFSSFMVQHRKLASLMREMGGLKNDGGILWRAFVEPMNKANDREAVMREQATLAMADIFKPLLQEGGLRRKLFIPEIGRSLSLEGRLAVALNWGNELNRARIMDGDKWSQPQAEAILRTLTAEQLGFVNRVWEYLDSYWPLVAAKERRVTGVEPQKVAPEPFQVLSADGQLVDMRGGYYPIKYDTERSSMAESHELAESIRGAMQGAYTRATTRRGHTKERVEKVERPVRKDLSVPFQHVNQVIHDLTFHEYLIDANRLIGAPAIDAAIRDHYGVEVLRTIKRTLQDIAAGDAPAENALDKVINYMRTGTTIAGLGFNFMTAAQQPLGLTQSMVRIGPKYLAKGIGMAFRDAVSLQNTVAAISDKSEFMRLRSKTMMREIAEVANKVHSTVAGEAAEKVLGRSAYKVKGGMDAVQMGMFAMITKLQLVADVPTWLGAYDKATAQGHDEETAIHLADQAVRDSQGSGQIGDLAQVQRGSVWFKLWTNFYSFFSVGYNQLAESVAETRRVGPARLPLLAADFALVAILPAVLGELMKHALRGDDWDWDKIGPDLAKAQLSYLFGFMVGLRELGSVVQSDGKAAAGPSALRLLSVDLPQLYQQAEQGEWDDAARKALLNTSGVLFHFPAAQINRTVDGFEAMAKGETQNPMALLFGKPRKATS